MLARKSMKLCKTCKFWMKEDDGMRGECTHPKLGENADRSQSDTLVIDTMEYPDLNVGADFGCIHHENK